MDRLKVAWKWWLENRKRIGAVVLPVWAVILEAEPVLRSNWRVVLYSGIATGLIFGAGAFKSDGYHKEKHGIEDILERNGLK